MAEGNRCCECCVQVELAVVPGLGEDSFTFRRHESGGLLCVADGCGGLGAKRYVNLDGYTGAYLAARIVTECVEEWEANGSIFFPQSEAEGRALCESLAQRLGKILRNFDAEYASTGMVRIVGRMQCALPTTLCAALFQTAPMNRTDCFFFWAGDSRGYILNRDGLHQVTEDHTTASDDALESLYSDAPLRNMVNAENPFIFSARRVRVETPCVVITATDGAFMYLPTPMEFEWVLLDTLRTSANLEAWQRKIGNVLKKVTSDDCTLLMAFAGYESFEEIKADMEKRGRELQSKYITPVRLRRQRLEFARKKWHVYREAYDWTKGKADGEMDWRV